jgi:DNA-binding MarR family transcriptional regulator
VNLFNCGIAYTAIPETVLSLRSKVNILAAVTIYRQGSLLSLERGGLPNITPYQRRKRSEVASDLVRSGVIAEAEDGLRLLDLADSPHRIVIPARCDFQRLSMNSLRVLLSLHHLNRYSRTPFMLGMTQDELSRKTDIAKRRLRDALTPLVAEGLIRIEKHWKAASAIVLLDPESGCDLYFLGKFFQERLDRIPCFDRYKAILADYDPRDSLRHCRGPAGKFEVHCPFCKRQDGWRSLAFEVDELSGIDRWKCFKCGRSGDSARLYTRLAPWVGRRGWQTLIPEICGVGVVDYAPRTDELEMNHDHS